MPQLTYIIKLCMVNKVGNNAITLHIQCLAVINCVAKVAHYRCKLLSIEATGGPLGRPMLNNGCDDDDNDYLH